MEQHYPKSMIAQGLEYVPFAGLRSYDPAGTQLDIAQAHVANVREGYNESGWDQPRWINHVSIRADDPAQVAEFYEKIFELKEAETYRDDGSICMTDGKVKLLLRPRDKSSLSRPARRTGPHRFQSREFTAGQRRSSGVCVSGAEGGWKARRRRQRQEKRRRLSPLLLRSTFYRRSRRRAGRYSGVMICARSRAGQLSVRGGVSSIESSGPAPSWSRFTSICSRSLRLGASSRACFSAG